MSSSESLVASPLDEKKRCAAEFPILTGVTACFRVIVENPAALLPSKIDACMWASMGAFTRRPKEVTEWRFDCLKINFESICLGDHECRVGVLLITLDCLKSDCLDSITN